MNIEVQSCSLIMLLILLAILLGEKSIDFSGRKKYLLTLLSCIICIAMDIMSVIAIVNASKGTFPEVLTIVICKLYLFMLVNVGYRGFLYASGEFFEGNMHRVLRNIYRVVFLAGSLAIIVLPLEYYCNGRIVYSFGPSAMATYAIAFTLFISTIIMGILRGKGTTGRRRRVILIWQISWIGAALIQFLKPDLLVVSFFAALGMVLIYAELENPNEGIDRVTGQFTYNELYSYVLDMYRRGVRFSAMHIRADYSEGNYDLELELKAMRRIARFLEEGGAFVFRESDRDFTVIYKDEERMNKDYERAVAGLDSAVSMPVRIAYGLIPDSGIFKTADEFMQFQHYHARFIDASKTMIAKREQADEMRNNLKIRDQINWALANDSIEVVYQPIYNVKTGSFTSAEALVRIHDSDGNIMMPVNFIPIAEGSGLIIPIGLEVFKQVCEFLASGKAQRLGIKYMETNLSMAQFDENEPAGFVQRIMAEYDIDPGWINLEITETADPQTRRVILKNMEILRNMGVHFSLDDFGTGRSNFDYFVNMPVDIVKFDYEYTHWYFKGEKAKDIVESIVGIIKRMEKPIVMEGIETKEQLDAMIELGASYIQGYYFSQPLTEAEFLEFLHENNGDVLT